MSSGTPRWRLRVAAILAIALCSAYVSVVTGHRLDHGSSSWHGTDAESRTEESRTEMRFVFGPGRQATFGVSIRNRGRWPVTITGINDGPGDQQVFKVVRLAMNHVDNPGAVVLDPAAAVPFRSVSVAAGTELPVFVTITMPDVQMAPGSGLFFEHLVVDYEVLGLPRQQRVPMGFRVLVHSANGYVPPDRARPAR
jgi:hypothetical protein